jgi:hypothetical protein
MHKIRGGIFGAASWKFIAESVILVPPAAGTDVPD